MMKQALVPINNLKHNVSTLMAQESLKDLARVYFLTEVAGQARATIEAKRRDLERFLGFYQQLYGHDRPDEWYRSVTREFLKRNRSEVGRVPRPMHSARSARPTILRKA